MGKIGNLDFVIFIVIYIMVIGIVSSVFNPAMYSFGEDDYINPDSYEVKKPESQSWWDKLLDAFSAIFNFVRSVMAFLWAGLTLDIPDIPWMVKVIFCAPIWGGTLYVIGSTLLKSGS